MGLFVENILDLIEVSGEDAVRRELSTFSCPGNSEIESFLKNSAIEFAKQKLSVTYIVRDEEDGSFLAYFTLGIKAVEVRKGSVSKSLEKRIRKYALYYETNSTYILASYLLAHFGKNYAVEHGTRIGGISLMDQVELIVHNIQHMIGVGLIYLDVEKNNEKAKDLYINRCNFTQFRERRSIDNSKEYIVMIKPI